MSTRLKIMSSSLAAPNDLLRDHRRALCPLWISIYSLFLFVCFVFLIYYASSLVLMHLSDVSLPSPHSILLSPFSTRGKLRHKKVRHAAQNKWKNWDLKPGSVVPDPCT